MNEHLWQLALAASLFTGGHFLLSNSWLRPKLLERFGERTFLAGYSLLMLLAFGWMLLAYARAPFVPVWQPPPALRHLALLIMPLAAVLFVGSLGRGNPTAVGAKPERLGRPAGIYAVTRHPMLWAFSLWALAHLLANGDAASMLLFGAILLLALLGTFAIDAKIRRNHPDGWRELSAHTSNLPLLAVVTGRSRPRTRALLLPLVGGILLFGVLLWAHPYLFGVSPLPG